MKSAADALLEMFGIHANVRPTKVESILIVLLHTLNKGKLLGQAISDIERLAKLDVEVPENLSYITTITGSPELVGLYRSSKAIQFLLHILPEISVIEEYGIITIPSDILSGIINRSDKSNRYREVKKILGQINELQLGYTIIQPPGVSNNTFTVLKASSRQDAIQILSKNDIQMPSVLDTILKDLK